MPRLRRSDPSAPGYIRRRRGRGFEYVDERTGARIEDPEALQRIKSLVIPPAWKDVWISPHPNGHLQAVGVDAAGRKQYRYHDLWRQRRDQQKFEHVLAFARALPGIREATRQHLSLPGLPREKVLACAVRLLDRGAFRIGGEDYAEENETFGLATIRKDHVRLSRGEIVFEFAAKGGKQWDRSVVDAEVHRVVRELKLRRAGGPELLAYDTDGMWRDVRSEDINFYLKEVSGGDYSAKDFRTWQATVLAAVGLAVSENAVRSRTAKKRAVVRVVKEVAEHLGNTPAVARKSYIDPRVIDRYESGVTIAGALEELGDVQGVGEPAFQGAIERAVLDLIEGTPSSYVERVAASA